MPSVLISGAGIAGPVLAWWLGRAGFETVVVERAPAPRPGGQAIDVRGRALDVVAAMGLSSELQALRTRFRGMSVLDETGEEASRTTERTMTGGAFDSGDIELFRDDAANLFIAATHPHTRYVFGDHPTAIKADEREVQVDFRNVPARSFDILIGADGQNSLVRRLVFGDAPGAIRPLGLTYAIFTLPNILELRDWQVAHRTPGGGFVFYPSRDCQELRANFVFPTGPDDGPRLAADAARAGVARHFGDIGGVVSRLLAEMPNAHDFYAGPLELVTLSAWSSGRVALLGDAAYCPSPFSGQGTSLAIVGAFVLATELAISPDAPTEAFARFERRMRPFVEANQALVDVKSGRPIPDDAMLHAKNAIVLDDLLAFWDR